MTPSCLEMLRNVSAADEFAGCDFGDKRLTDRCVSVAGMLMRSPSTTLPAMAANASELEAAYRFMNNENVVPGEALAPHFAATGGRASAARDVYAVHDTSDIGFRGDRRGAGRLSGKGKGFRAHPALVITADGLRVPLGVVALQLSVRTGPARAKKKHQVSYSYGAHNEATRWITGVRESAARLTGAASVVHVMDREADSYLLLSTMIAEGHRFITRLKNNRALETAGLEPCAPARVSEALLELDPVAERDATLSRRRRKGIPAHDARHPAREARTAHLQMSATAVVIKRPAGAPAHVSEHLRLNVVHVREPAPPEGVEPVEWILLTTEAIDTPEDVLRVVDGYRARWPVEEYFKALKSGCRVEERGFDTIHALMNIFALSVPVAWQMLLLRTLARIDEKLPAKRALTEMQLAVLASATARLPPSQRLPRNPTVRHALLSIAAIGGHLRRNGEPGWHVLSRGFRRLRELEIGFRAGLRAARRGFKDV